MSYVGAAATKSIILGLIILATAGSVRAAAHRPSAVDDRCSCVLTAVTFSLVGFIIGIWADGFEKLQLVPLLIVTPLTFLGGSFYSIDMLPPFWQTVTLFNPVVYLISGFRWSFYGIADVSVGVSLAMTMRIHGDIAGDRGVDIQDRIPLEVAAIERDRLPVSPRSPVARDRAHACMASKYAAPRARRESVGSCPDGAWTRATTSSDSDFDRSDPWTTPRPGSGRRARAAEPR